MIPGLTVIPERRSFRKSLELCQRLGGEMAVPEDKGATEDFERMFIPHQEKCEEGRIWLGVWDFPAEGNFTNVNTGKEVRAVMRI